MPAAESELHFDSPYQLIVAVILSAQCTDRRVNVTTPVLFKKYPGIQDLAAAEVEDVYQLIKSISYPRSKAEHLVKMAGMVVRDFGGKIPPDLDQLMKLPGVGRKTAAVVASIAYDKPFIAVDTHVFRVAHRLGLSTAATPSAVALELERNIPPELRPIAHHWLILHGRYVCTARNPKCDGCGLKDCCKNGPLRTS